MINGRFLGFWGWVKIWRHQAVVLYYAWKHPQTPVWIKTALFAVLAYLFSPIDLIPDYLPLLGMTDDVALVTIALVMLPRFLPEAVYDDCQRASEKWYKRLPWFLVVIGLFILFWIVLAMVGIYHLIFR